MTSVEWVTLTVLLIGVIAGVWKHEQFPQDAQYLTYFFVLTFILEINADYYMSIFRRNNLFLYHTFIPFQYIPLALFLRENSQSKTIRKWINWSIVLVLITAALFSGFVQSLKEMPFYSLIITRILLLFWALLYLRQLINSKEMGMLSRIPAFWVASGILIYFISFFQMGLMRYLIVNERKLAGFWIYIVLWFDVGFYSLCLYPLLKFWRGNWPPINERNIT